jgi:pimeloyl-ACP methyl ester carboxylesterase
LSPAAPKKKKPATRAKTQRSRSPEKNKKRGKNPLKKALIILATLAVLAYISAGAWLYIKQRQFIYFPTQGVEPTAEQVIELQNQDVTLRGWMVNPEREDAIIYFGGNAERIENSITDYKPRFSEFTIYFINYRGYGESTGTPTEQGLYSDAEAIFDYVQQRHSRVTVIGRSLGTGIATHLAANRELQELILVTPFDNLATAAQAMYPIFPVELLMKDQYNSAENAPLITEPTLIIIAGNDEVISRASTDRLIEQFNPGIVHTALIEGATHNDIQEFTQYYLEMRDFQLTDN